MQPSSPERRQYFRIAHDIIFDYKMVDVHVAEQGLPEDIIGGSPSMQLLAELRVIDKDLARMAKVLNEKQRLLGDYLQKLSSKIDLIAHHSVFSGASAKHAERLSISEGGVAFECDRALYKGNFLVLQIIFLPGYTPVIVFAQVTRCDAQNDCYRVAASFHRLRDSDRQELARQVLRAQVNQRKRVTTPENKL